MEDPEISLRTTSISTWGTLGETEGMSKSSCFFFFMTKQEDYGLDKSLYVYPQTPATDFRQRVRFDSSH